MIDQRTIPLTENFGVEVQGVQLGQIKAGAEFDQLRSMFEEHSALLFRAQDIDDEQHLALGKLFGPIEDRLADERKPDEAYVVPRVSNVLKDGTLSGEMDLHTLHLKANMMWHADSTFMPNPALTNILVSRVTTSHGGATEFASTRAAWSQMPKALKVKIEGRGIWHKYSHSRARISPELAALPMFHKWPDQHWNAVWKNPSNGREALYIASHAFKIDGYNEAESQVILDELMAFCTQPQFVYRHEWSVGDVLIWDQRAVLHRATPWPQNEPRTLTSICVSTTDRDGLSLMRHQSDAN
ncbi:TauD/TfdA dioxygenase family protein [Cochlodiniinecator piscidefendens]|uniref:TauD/TfdA dioxygenase family protein n=1 Tax=Cochlodiniinecator piscidefendens TaxID=2715756 RepID=UPI00140CE3E2|nr:TauD/TfdA family dioxygenase [Cochlodiniinecator piscidefendens]